MSAPPNSSWTKWWTFGLLGASAQASSITQTGESSPLVLTTGVGLHMIHNALDAEVDIVFVHGLTGSRDTWKRPRSGGLWPQLLLPKDIPKSRIFLWEYDADVFRFMSHPSSNKLHDHGANFCDRLAGRRSHTKTQGRPLIFVCHSLGGLVSTRALLHAEESGDSLYKDVANSTVGFLFLGTPFRGSQIANWGKLGTDFIRVTSDVNKDIVTLLKPDSEILFQLRISFVNLLRKRAQNSNGGIIVKTIFEELGMTLIGKVVDRTSAVLDGYPYASIHENHVAMTKFEDETDLNYGGIVEWLSAVICQITGQGQFFSDSGALSIVGEQTHQPYGLLPQNAETIHRNLSAWAFWNTASPKPSQDFGSFKKHALMGSRRQNEGREPIGDLNKILKRASSDFHSHDPRHTTSAENTSDLRSFLLDPTTSSVEVGLEEIPTVRTISAWISNIDHRAMHDSTSSQRYVANGVWLSSKPEFIQWRDRPTSSIFWLSGPPGSGKSVLSSFVVDALSANRNVCVVYFYCDNKQYRNHTSILRSLLKQVYLVSPNKERAESFYRSHKDAKLCDEEGTDPKQYYDLFLGLLRLGRIYLVLDGLERCTADGLDMLFNAWRHVSSRSNHVLKLFISSRENDILHEKLDWQIKENSSRGWYKLSTSLMDDVYLEAFIQERLETVAESWDIWQQSSGTGLVDLIAMNIKASARGSWTWARRAISSIDTSSQAGKGWSDSTQLQHVYQQLLAEIAAAESLHAAIAERTLYWILFALEPLTVSEIATAVNLSMDNNLEPSTPAITAEKILDCCRGLLKISENKFQFTHFTAQEYLAESLNSSLGNVFLTKTCLVILSTLAPVEGRESQSCPATTPEETLYDYAKRNYMIHGFKSVALDQRVGPYIEADNLPGFERIHGIEPGQAAAQRR